MSKKFMIKKKKYFIFVFKHRFRKIAFNNFLKIKQIKDYKVLDLSGPFKFFFFSRLLIFVVNLFPKIFENVTLISCDGRPFIKKRAVNIWFGGTNLKIPKHFQSYNNNIAMIKSSIDDKRNFVSLYPYDLKKNIFNKNFKIVFIGRLNLSNSPEVKAIWNKYNRDIINNFLIIENKKFFQTIGIKKIEHMKNIYLGLKNEIRLNIIKKLHKEFKDDLIVVGNDWESHIENSIKDNHDIKFVKDLYKGNLCVDFGSKWGNNSLYPRSIEIIESSGVLVQCQQPDTNDIFRDTAKFVSFNSYQNLSNIILMYKKDHKKLNLNYEKICSLFNNNEMNYKTLTKIIKISNQ